jgi:hypothetical protein
VTRRRLLVVLAGWALLTLALWASDAHPAVFVLGGVVAAIAGTLYVMLDLADAVDEVEWTRRARRQTPVRRADPRVSSMRRKAQATWWSGSSGIGDTLVELVDDRLLAHHRVDRATDPAGAAALLSPALRALVQAPQRTSTSPRELQHLLTEIEAL